MHWRLSVSLTLVQFLWFGLALSTNEITGVGSEANNLFINAFPRNIYHIFKGSWQFINESDSRNVGFEKQEGAIWFSLSNEKFSSEFDLVQGEAVIRDGIYSTDKNMKFLLQGAYFFQQGTLLLLALPTNPYVEELAPTAFFSTLSDMTAAQALIAVEKIISETSSYNGTTPNLCPFRFVLQMRPERPLSLSDQITMSKPELIAAEPTVNVTLGGHLFSRCDVMMSITAGSVQISDYSSKWIKYVVMVLLSSFVQIFVLRRQMEYTRTQAYASKMSLLTVGAQAVLDVYLCLIYLTGGVVIEQMFTAFVTAAFFQFVLFLLFEMRYLMVILQARRSQAFAEGWIALRREFSLFCLRFYTFVLGGFILIYYMGYLLYIFIFIMHSFWVPQIVYNAQKCSIRPVLWQYVIGMSVTRLTIPLYFFGCPHNFLMVEPSFLMCFLLTAYMAAQIFVMYLQDKKGPQFFVPKRFLALKHPMSEVQRYEVKVEAAEFEKKT